MLTDHGSLGNVELYYYVKETNALGTQTMFFMFDK